MTVLVLGGTGFIGPHVVEALRRRGRDVVVFNRGESATALPDGVRLIRGNRDPDVDGGLGELRAAIGTGERFEAVIDISCYVPRHAAASARVLADACERYVFVSTISVYESYDASSIDEDAPLAPLADPTVEAITPTTYGPLKVACEREVLRVFDDRAAIVRPGLVVGPGDPTDRFTWWPVRVAQGGPIPFPRQRDPDTAFAQWLDARDLAAFLVDVALDRERDELKRFVANAVGPRHPVTLRELAEACLAHAPAGTALVDVPESRFLAVGVSPISGCPLWIPQTGEHRARLRGMLSIDHARAIAAGLTHRPMRDTIADTLTWFRETHADWPTYEFGVRPKQGGINHEQEAALLEGV